ncbi:hypothetical protein J3B02_003381 [Coemansia erecta]|uniref:UreD-domain-containing protein n=1 Tax=Coemansia asiatica TaxID=1052880 RepID=A0A9W8CKG1_9FUNG|nr:hypothetical protein LPJ64_000945 [Coemansia asiatica]KAJ2852889.1 hypothetical protein J3B02_003381 [Coemansia erecta]KAJ2872291.1 hypothetical protein FB639_004364 [Coemansia asiatica]
MPAPGEGKISCQLTAGRLFQTISSAYPLKIISPKAIPNTPTSTEEEPSQKLQPAVSYILSYGGGIVHGDQIHVDVNVGSGCALMLLTQGSTKIYKNRSGRPPSYLKNPRNDAKFDINQSYQTMIMDVAPGALLCLLPDPVTCFKDALYNQRQAVRLHDCSSSLVLLDWMTSGRMSRGERWDFAKYFSVNIVTLGYTPKSRGEQWMDGSKILIRDALLLKQPGDPSNIDQLDEPGSFARRLENIDAFAFLLILGPSVEQISRMFVEEHKKYRIKAFRMSKTREDEEGVWWSVSEVDEQGVTGVAVRAAGPSTEVIREWIKRRLLPLQSVVGDSAWSMYFNA